MYANILFYMTKQMQKMEEEYLRVKEEKELEKRRREAVEAEAKEQALAEAQRRKEANERAAALARQHEDDEADSAGMPRLSLAKDQYIDRLTDHVYPLLYPESRQRPHRRAASDVPPRRQEENDDLSWEATASPQRSHPSIFSQGGRRHHPR